jgi:hypothetical protein
MLRLTTAAVALACLSTACGALDDDKKKGDGAGATTTTMNGMAFADEQSLPACDATTNNMLAYVKDTKTFETCADGAWTKVDVKGEAGAKGDPGADGAPGDEVTTKAIELYKKYKRSVFQISLQCANRVGPTTTCGTSGLYFGSGFLCGDDVICTNEHVVACDPACYTTFTSLKVTALAAGNDSLNQGADPEAPFMTVTSTAAFRYSTDTRATDLAKFTATGLPSGLTPVTIETAPASQSVTSLMPVLSMSYPLAYADLYTDLGRVDTPFLGECDTDGGVGGVGCLKDYYDFGTTNITDHGSSGSPLFDVATGKVVGVTSAGTDGQNANYTWAIDASRFSKVP